MSAAEKLRELALHKPGNHWDAEVNAALLKALPEIIAVVEAAEMIPRTLKYLKPEEIDLVPEDATAILDCTAGEVKRVLAALAALDAALTVGGKE